MAKYAVVRFRAEGWHRWEGATGKREYLANKHRHLFHVEVQLEVFHNDREVEFHDLLDFCRESFEGDDMQGKSCEMMAEEMIKKIARQFGDERAGLVAVYEDGEVGASVDF